MAIEAEEKRKAVALKLNNGTTATGAVKTVSVSLGPLSIASNAYDRQKAVNIANLLYRCLDLAVYSLEETTVNELSEE